MTAAAVALPVLGGVVAILFGLALAAAFLPGRVMAAALAACCSVVIVAALAASLAGGRAAVAIPIGLGLLPGLLALDPLGAWFLLALGIAGLTAARARGRTLPLLLATAMLLLLAGDTGIAVLGLAGFAAVCGVRGAGLAGVVLAALALAVLSPDAGTTFAAIRTAPPEGARAAAVLALLLAGVALVVLTGPFRQLASGTAAGLAAPLAVLLAGVGGYLLCRVTLDLCGPAIPGWWGAPALLAGSAAACAGAAFALRAASLPAVLAGLALGQAGWVVAGTGLVAVAQSADLVPLATLAGGGTMMQMLALALSGSLAAFTIEAASRGAGSLALDRLGGLAARMPVTAAAMLVALASLALLPPGAGFAGGWMLLQAAFAATRIGNLALHFVVAVAVLGLAGSTGLALAAVVRAGGLAMLGRPRTPRAAAAEEAAVIDRVAMVALSAVCLLLGLFPGLAVRLATPAQELLTRALPVGQASWAGLQTQLAVPGYLPLVVALLGLAGFAALVLAARRLQGTQTVPAWEDGFAPPPPWLPFGDPATQATAAVLASLLPSIPRRRQTLPRLQGWPTVEWPRVPPQATLLGVAVALILAVLLLGPP